MKLTVVTPTFNSAATLADTMRSVAGQDYPALEHLIIDGLSTDETLQIARRFPHLSRVVSEPDKGLYDAMNKGIALATGDVIGILNSDDFYTHPQVLSRVMALMQKTGAAVLYADLEYVKAQHTGRVVRMWKAGAYRPGLFFRGWMPPHPTFFVRREVYEKFGVYQPDMRFSADYELMLRVLHRYKAPVCYLPEVIVRMRTGGVSNASLRSRWLANREDRLAWQLNGLTPPFYTLYMKPLSKVGQYFRALGSMIDD